MILAALRSHLSSFAGLQDYVYAFMPATNATVSISLCNSGYDTKLIVYQSTSDGQLLEVLCSDDYCNLQSWAQVGAAHADCHRAERLPLLHHICRGLECLLEGPASRLTCLAKPQRQLPFQLGS